MAEAESSKRDRSPKFPYIGLSRALERIEVLFSKVKRNEARIQDIAKDWGLSATSSSTDRTVAALQSFGLVEDLGSGENRKIKISEIGARILMDQRPGVREALLSETALKPTIISEYARKWIAGRPDDAHALSDLQFEGRFTAEGAKMFLRVFDETIRFAQLSRSETNSDRHLEDVVDKGDDSPDNNNTTDIDPTKDRGNQTGVGPNRIMREDVFTLAEGNVSLRWPAALSEDSFQDLEDWTKLILRKIKRTITSGTEPEAS